MVGVSLVCWGRNEEAGVEGQEGEQWGGDQRSNGVGKKIGRRSSRTFGENLSLLGGTWKATAGICLLNKGVPGTDFSSGCQLRLDYRGMYIFCGSPSVWPCTGALKQERILLTVLEAGSLEIKVLVGLPFFLGSRRVSVFQLPFLGGFRQSLACGCITPISVSSHGLFSSLFSPLPFPPFPFPSFIFSSLSLFLKSPSPLIL